MEYKLGRSITQITRFHRIQLQKPTLPKKEIITKKLLVTMLIVAIVKIAVLVTLW